MIENAQLRFHIVYLFEKLSFCLYHSCHMCAIPTIGKLNHAHNLLKTLSQCLCDHCSHFLKKFNKTTTAKFDANQFHLKICFGKIAVIIQKGRSTETHLIRTASCQDSESDQNLQTKHRAQCILCPWNGLSVQRLCFLTCCIECENA